MRFNDIEDETSMDVVRVPEGFSFQIGPLPNNEDENSYISVVVQIHQVRDLIDFLTQSSYKSSLLSHSIHMKKCMKIRRKGIPSITGRSHRFNSHGLAEIIVMFDDDDGDMDSQSINDYEVYLETSQEWMDMQEAFKLKLIITDKYNLYFGEPQTLEDKERGYWL